MSEFELRRALRALDGGRTPERDLWPGIAARLGEPHVQSQHPAPRPGRGRWPLLLALAASLVVAVLLALPLLPPPTADTESIPLAATEPVRDAPTRSAPMRSPALLQAEALALEYSAVLDQFQGAPLPASLQPTLADLDGSAREIHAALRQDPGADFLLDQLRRTYAQRLHVTRLALAG